MCFIFLIWLPIQEVNPRVKIHTNASRHILCAEYVEIKSRETIDKIEFIF